MSTNNITIPILSVTIIILLLIIGIILVIISARRQNIQQELKEVVYQNKLNESILASLRAQINPHFIFNCLNSIKLYTEQNNSVAASEYLSKFSKLIRNILNHARDDVTILSGEIETLQLYLDLESMRFKDKLKCSILIDENLDIDFIEIPPLIIQPYVENAIWHGIMPKLEGGEIIISIKQNEQNNELIISVEDNGIGRVQSALMKKKSDNEHKSFGTKISQDRLSLINEKNKSLASVNIVDMYSKEGQACGTRVTIKLQIL